MPLPILDDVDVRSYDFLDFGTSYGGSILNAQRLFGGRGLGIDRDPKKIQGGRELGREVVLGDILSLPREPVVRYVVMDNFLEHLPTLELAQEMVAVAVAVAREFVYIVNPSFEHEDYLASLGLRQYWQDWHGHPAHLLVSDLEQMLRAAGVQRYEVRPVGLVKDSRHASVLPVTAPRDQHHYDAAKHGPKPVISFNRQIYERFELVGSIDGQTLPRTAPSALARSPRAVLRTARAAARRVAGRS